MRLRAGHHGFSTAARAFTLAAVVAASLGQFASLAHEMTVRHFRCAEHGELTHVAAVASASLADATGRAEAAKDALRAPSTAVVDAHEHCGLTFTVEGSAPTPSASRDGSPRAAAARAYAGRAALAGRPRRRLGRRAQDLTSARLESPPRSACPVAAFRPSRDRTFGERSAETSTRAPLVGADRALCTGEVSCFRSPDPQNPKVRSLHRSWVLGVALATLPARAFAQAAADAPGASRVQPPVVVEEKRPPYPADGGGARGDVAVMATIAPTGDVSAVALAGAVAPALDRAALQAAMGWRFKPAQRDGVPVAARVQLLFHFEPPAEAPAAPPAAPPPPSPTAGQAQPAEPPPVAVPLPAAPAPATEPAAPPAGKPPAALDVTVVGRRPPPSRGASDFQIRVGQLAEVPRANASDLLRLAPGILLTNEGGEGHAEQVYMRGFDAREGQDVEFTVGGVPINESGNLHGNGYADTHFIIPELIESLRVVEGPFDPRQGNYAVAGSADYELGLEQRGPVRQRDGRQLGDAAGAGPVRPARREHAHVRRRRDLRDRRLRSEPRRAARLGDGAVRRALRGDRLLAAHRPGLRVPLPLGRASFARTTTSRGGSAFTTATT